MSLVTAGPLALPSDSLHLLRLFSLTIPSALVSVALFTFKSLNLDLSLLICQITLIFLSKKKKQNKTIFSTFIKAKYVLSTVLNTGEAKINKILLCPQEVLGGKEGKYYIHRMHNVLDMILRASCK